MTAQEFHNAAMKMISKHDTVFTGHEMRHFGNTAPDVPPVLEYFISHEIGDGPFKRYSGTSPVVVLADFTMAVLELAIPPDPTMEVFPDNPVIEDMVQGMISEADHAD